MTFSPLHVCLQPVALLALVGAGLAAPLAHAGDALPNDGLIEVLPTGAVLAGETVEVHVVALDATGSPVSGLELRPVTTAGTVGPWQEVAPGLYAFALTIPSSGKAPQVTLTGKRADKSAVELSRVFEVSVSPAAEALTLTADPKHVVLGKDPSAHIEGKGAGGQGVLARTSVGDLGKVVQKADGTVSLAFTPPKVNFPQVAVITLADSGQPNESFGVHFLPLTGSVAYPVTGPAGASVLLEVAGREFGPTELDASGKGKVQIEVPPGVDDATQLTIANGKTTEKALNLGIPGAKRLGFVPTQKTVATTSTSVPIRVAVATPEGQPDNEATPTFAVSAGSVSDVERVADGVYEVRFTPPKTAVSVEVTATLTRDVDVDTVSFDVVRGLQGTVGLAAEPWPVTGTELSAVATSSGVVGQVGISVRGGTAGTPYFDGPKVTLAVSDVDVKSLRVSAQVELSTSTDGVRQVLLLADRHHVLPGGRTDVLVVTVDEDGLPVADQEVVLAVVDGEGSVEDAVRTGADGTVLVSLAGTDVGVLALRGVSAGYSGEVGVVVAPEGALVPTLPAVGMTAATWKATRPVLLPQAKAEVVATPWGDVAAAPEEPTPEVPVPESTVKPEVVDVPYDVGVLPAPADVPWMRVRASAVLSTYRYEQTPSEAPGDVLNRSLSVGGAAGSPASPAGFEVDGRMWLDPANVPYLGLHASLRNTWYSIQSSAFDQPATDQLLNAQVDLLARYPFDAGGDRFWVGARGGFHYDDFIYFQGCVDQPGCTVGYAPLSVPGLGVGPELGAEIGRLFVIGGYSFGLANFSQPYSHTFDLDVGLRVAGPVFVDLGFGSVSRKVSLVGADSAVVRGQLTDAQMLFDLGVGVAF